MINSKKTAKQAELDKQYNEAKAKISKEVRHFVLAACRHGFRFQAAFSSWFTLVRCLVLAACFHLPYLCCGCGAWGRGGHVGGL